MTHTPIPEFLTYQDESKPGYMTMRPLPPDLDRLFRASPKLVDALRELRRAIGDVWPRLNPGLPDRRYRAVERAYEQAHIALADAGLEE